MHEHVLAKRLTPCRIAEHPHGKWRPDAMPCICDQIECYQQGMVSSIVGSLIQDAKGFGSASFQDPGFALRHVRNIDIVTAV